MTPERPSDEAIDIDNTPWPWSEPSGEESDE